jgi:hypothetical protein
LDGQDGTTLIERAFFSHECRSLPADDPNLNLRRRLADQRRYPERSRMGDLLLFVAFAFILRVFSPKIACQVPKPLKSNKQKKIEVAF